MVYKNRFYCILYPENFWIFCFFFCEINEIKINFPSEKKTFVFEFDNLPWSATSRLFFRQAGWRRSLEVFLESNKLYLRISHHFLWMDCSHVVYSSPLGACTHFPRLMQFYYRNKLKTIWACNRDNLLFLISIKCNQRIEQYRKTPNKIHQAKFLQFFMKEKFIAYLLEYEFR